MGDKVTIPPMTIPDNSSFVPALNEAIQKLSDELDKVVYRDGSQSMTGSQNMAGRRIYNLPEPVNASEPLRLEDLIRFLAGEGLPSINSAVFALLDKKNAFASSTTELAAAPTNTPVLVIGTDAGYNGSFVFRSGNYSNAVAADTSKSIFVAPATDPTGATGAWVREYTGVANIQWFGARGDGVTNCNTAISLAVALFNAGHISGIYFPTGAYRVSTTFTVNRSGFVLAGDGARNSTIEQSANVDTFRFVSTAPLLQRISDIQLFRIGINASSVVAPTAGIALKLTRADRVMASDFTITNVYNGILFEGGADQKFNNVMISGAYSWSTVQPGSWLVKFTNFAGTTEQPSEIFFNNFNIKGSNNLLERCLVCECYDGLFFTNGHVGFSDLSSVHVNPQNGAGLSCLNLEFTGVYFDGNNAGNASGANIEINGSATPTFRRILLNGCVIKNYPGAGVRNTLSSLRDLSIIGCQFSDLGKQNITLDTGSGVRIYNNSFNGGTVDMEFGPGANNVKTGGNQREITPVVSVASIDGFTLPMGYEVVEITGSANMSNINAPNLKGYIVTLYFSGTASFNDNLGNVNLVSNFTATAGSTLTLMNNGTKWVEVSRAIV